MEFCNSPQLLLQLQALAAAGVTEVILAISYAPNVMEEFILQAQRDLNIKIVCSHEPEPLGTAGPIAYARDFLNTKEPFFVLYQSITCAFPLQELLAFHRTHGREGTVFVTKVEEPSRYGVVQHDPSGKVLRFVNKPKQYSGNLVSLPLPRIPHARARAHHRAHLTGCSAPARAAGLGGRGRL